MIARLPNSVLGKLVFASGLVWVLFGSVLLFAQFGGLFTHDRNPPNEILILPVFGLVWLGTDFAIDWIHQMGLLVASFLFMGTGLSICIYFSPRFTRVD
jgi:hypothetical protein